MRLAVLALILGAAAAGAARADDPERTFQDWQVTCDNLRTCVAFGFSAEDSENPSYLRIARGGGANAAASVSITTNIVASDNPGSGPWTLLVDSRAVPGVTLQHAPGDVGQRASLSPAQATALLAAIRNGRSLQVRAGATTVAEISLSGSAAALLNMDDRQRRVGTTTALIGPGPRPAAGILPVPAAPVVVRGRIPQQTAIPRRPPRSVLAQRHDCDPAGGLEGREAQTWRLGPNLVLWSLPCTGGAYNVGDQYVLADNAGGGARRVRFPLPPGSENPTEETPVNSEFNPANATIVDFAKARGLGDCGTSTSWTWDGSAFRLLRQTAMSQCRAVVDSDWPTTFVGVRR
jgi:hypothetical protein